MSWKCEVIAYGSGKWVGNGITFADREEARAYACDLFSRWTAVREHRTVESDEPALYRWHEGRAQRLEPL